MFQLIHVFLMGGFPSTWPRIGWCWMPLSIAASCGKPCLRSRGWIWMEDDGSGLSGDVFF
jgi:hypothetical protein